MAWLGTFSEGLETLVLGHGDAPRRSSKDLEALAWDLRGTVPDAFVDPLTVARAMSISVVEWTSSTDLVVRASRIFVRAGTDGRERGTMIGMGVATAVLAADGLSFNDADAAILCCEVAAPARLVERATTSALARLQPHLTVGLLAAWGARCRGESGFRRKKTGS